VDLKEILWVCLVRNKLAIDKDKWRAIVNMIMNFRVS
jgi:hypothetical protein